MPRSRPTSFAAGMLGVLALCGSEEVLPDRDGDAIPDAHDPFPDDRDRPGQASPNVAYAHTSTALYSLPAEGQDIRRVGDFTFADGVVAPMTDIAIDRWGVMWAVGFDRLYVCHPATARCEFLRGLPASFNALAVMPIGPDDALIAATVEGAVFRLSREAEPESLGAYGARSSGDLVFEHDRLRASVDGADGSDSLVDYVSPQLDPSSAVKLPTTAVYGLAACARHTFAFDESGEIFVRQNGGPFDRLAATGLPFWGASCRGVGPAVVAAGSGPQPDRTATAEAPSPVRSDEPASSQAGSGLSCACN